jgi:feruloyl-CoA synthase
VLENRKDLIERIYAATPGDDIILAR